MDDDTTALADAMDQLAAFLAEGTFATWSDRVRKDAARVRRGDGHGVTHFLMWFGGMGSLNDLSFEGKERNDRLIVLLDRAYSLANRLRREATPPESAREFRRR